MSERNEPRTTRAYPAEKARQGEIVLRRPWQRWVFIAGLAGFILLALVVAWLAGM